jgi:hypothetical protein
MLGGGKEGPARHEEMGTVGYREQHHDPVPGRPPEQHPPPREGDTPQRILSLPAYWFGPVDRQFLWALRHPLQGYRRWAWRRRNGPYLPDDDSLGGRTH